MRYCHDQQGAPGKKSGIRYKRPIMARFTRGLKTANRKQGVSDEQSPELRIADKKTERPLVEETRKDLSI
jgi:hypothetical protein